MRHFSPIFWQRFLYHLSQNKPALPAVWRIAFVGALLSICIGAFAPVAARAQSNISGTINGTTDTVTLDVTGALTGMFFSGAGSYVLTSFPNGSYTITPSLIGFTFSPASRTVTVAGANIFNADFTATPIGGATITNFTPAIASTGAVVTITGTNFTGASAVSFGGVSAAFVVNSATQISATVAAGGASGAVSVTTPLGTVLAAGFTFTTATVSMSSTATTAPVISGIANQTLPVSSSTAVIPFTVSDVETPFSALTVFGSSDNQVLLPNANILFSGSGSVRGVRLVPVVGETGTAQVTIGVFDGALLTTTTFTLNVTAPVAPVISSFSPQSASQLTSVSIVGQNFSAGSARVSFGGLPAAAATVVNDTLIVAVVGNGASGNVTVTTSGGTASAAGFTYLPPAPQISGFAPQRATTGTVVIIFGQNFVNVTSVTLGGTQPQSYMVASTTQIVAVVGAGSSGAVRVATSSGAASEPGFVYVAPPSVSGFSPLSGAVGTQVTIFGFGFSGARAVRFGGVMAATYRIVSDTRIDAVLGNGASGVISVTGEGGTAVSAGVFTLSSGNSSSIVVSGFSPSAQTVDSVMTIFGVGFTGATAVSVGGAPAEFQVLSDTQIRAIVGRFAQDGAVVVTSPLGIAQLGGFRLLQPMQPTQPGVTTAPVISAIAEQTIIVSAGGASPLVIPFTVSGGAVPAAFLQVSVSSNNAALVPNANLTLATVGGAGSARTLTIQPSGFQTGFQTGRAIITLGVSDGQRASTTAFAVNIVPVATLTAPVVTGFAPTVVVTNGTVVISGRGFTGATNVTFGGVQAMFSVDSDERITAFVSAGASGEVRVFTPRGSGAFGGFTFVPAGRNLPPSISPIPNQFALPGNVVGPILFAVEDVNQPASSLRVFAASSNPLLLPNENIIFGGGTGAGSLRTLTLLPTPGQVGTAVVTVVVFNEVLTNSTQFQLTVRMPSSISSSSISSSSVSSSSILNASRGASSGALSNAALHVFPNPATDAITLNTSLEATSEVTMRLVSVLGETMLTTRQTAPQGAFTTTLDVSTLPAGVYAIEVRAGAQRWTERVVRGN